MRGGILLKKWLKTCHRMQQKNEDTFNRPRRYLHKPMKVPSWDIEDTFIKKAENEEANASPFSAFFIIEYA